MSDKRIIEKLAAKPNISDITAPSEQGTLMETSRPSVEQLKKSHIKAHRNILLHRMVKAGAVVVGTLTGLTCLTAISMGTGGAIIPIAAAFYGVAGYKIIKNLGKEEKLEKLSKAIKVAYLRSDMDFMWGMHERPLRLSRFCYQSLPEIVATSEDARMKLPQKELFYEYYRGRSLALIGHAYARGNEDIYAATLTSKMISALSKEYAVREAKTTDFQSLYENLIDKTSATVQESLFGDQRAQTFMNYWDHQRNLLNDTIPDGLLEELCNVDYLYNIQDMEVAIEKGTEYILKCQNTVPHKKRSLKIQPK